MKIIKYSDGRLELMSNNMLVQPWVDKKEIVKIVDIGYYEVFIKTNIKQILKLVENNELVINNNFYPNKDNGASYGLPNDASQKQDAISEERE